MCTLGNALAHAQTLSPQEPCYNFKITILIVRTVNTGVARWLLGTMAAHHGGLVVVAPVGGVDLAAEVGSVRGLALQVLVKVLLVIHSNQACNTIR